MTQTIDGLFESLASTGAGYGVAWVDDTNIKVVEIVLDKLAYGWSPEEIHAQHPHLSLGQIHAALSYYHDNQTDLDAQIQSDFEASEKLRLAAAGSPLQAKLRDLKARQP